MSDHSQIIVDLDATPEDAPRLAHVVLTWLAEEGVVQREPAPDSVLGDNDGHRPGPKFRKALEEPEDESAANFLDLGLNGLEIEVGRTVFHSGGNGTELRCEACEHEFDPGDKWGDAVDAWYEGDDEVTFPCPSCGEARRLPEWRGPWQWGFGNLGFQFWNWPPLSDEFIDAVSEKLGHRTVLVRMHL